jgi:hypothetical protein
MEDHTIIVSIFGKLNEVFASLRAVLIKEGEMNIAHRGLKDNFVGLILRTHLVYCLDLLFVWTLVQNITNYLVIRCFLRKLFRKDIESSFFESCCVYCRISSSLLAFGC